MSTPPISQSLTSMGVPNELVRLTRPGSYDLAPGYRLDVHPMRVNGEVMVDITLDTPHGPMRALFSGPEETVQRNLQDFQVRYGAKMQSFWYRNGARVLAFLGPSIQQRPMLPRGR